MKSLGQGQGQQQQQRQKKRNKNSIDSPAPANFSFLASSHDGLVTPAELSMTTLGYWLLSVLVVVDLSKQSAMIGIPTLSMDCLGCSSTSCSFDGDPAIPRIRLNVFITMAVLEIFLLLVDDGGGATSEKPVAHQITASHRSTDEAISVGDVKSHETIVRRSFLSSSSSFISPKVSRAFSIDRTIAITGILRFKSSSTTNRPVLPVAPVTPTVVGRMTPSFSFSSLLIVLVANAVVWVRLLLLLLLL